MSQGQWKIEIVKKTNGGYSMTLWAGGQTLYLPDCPNLLRLVQEIIAVIQEFK